MIGSFACHIRIALLSSAGADGEKAGRPKPKQQTTANDGLKSICSYPPITSWSSYASLTMGQLVVSAGCEAWPAAGESLCSAMMLLRESLSLSLAHLTSPHLTAAAAAAAGSLPPVMNTSGETLRESYYSEG